MDLLLSAMATSQDGSIDRAVAKASLERKDKSHPLAAGEQGAPKRQQRRSSQNPPTHQCRICQRTYERADRLSRHLRTHENARRHACQWCQKSFNRADLLTRHVVTHTRSEAGANAGLGPKAIQRTDRAGQACIACAAAKARCEDRKPCRRCQSKDIVCEVTSQPSYDTQQRELSGDRASQDSSTCPASPEQSSEALRQELSASQQRQQRQQQQQHPLRVSAAEQEPSTVVANHSSNAPTNQATNYQVEADREGAALRSAAGEAMLPEPSFYNMHPLPIQESQLVFDNIMNEMLFMPVGANFNNQNLDIDFHDFTFQDQRLDSFPAPLLESNSHEAPTVEAAVGIPQPTRDVRAGYAAFMRSPWLWTPEPWDHVLHNGEDLTLDEGSISTALMPRSSDPMPNVPSCGFPTITSAMRDKMYHLVSAVNRFTNRIPDFPSLDIVNHVVEAFFVRQTYRVDNWIHVPSMSMSHFIPELGLALLIAGSTVISVPAIWKMGLVLQDVVRLRLGDLWERENSATRKLQPLQAWMLALDAGLWSGFQRQMELAESFTQSIVTMMRRGGMFSATADTQSLVPLESDTWEVLNAKWTKWTERESFKRLSIHLFLHDTQASIALQKYPLISITEITFSLPSSQMLFLASSAIEWRSCFRERIPSAPPSLQLVDIMHDIDILETLHSEIDVNLCYNAVVHGFWCQIWAFRESWKLHSMLAGRDSVHRLWLVTQQREVYRQVEAFGQSLLLLRVPAPDLLIMVELLLMILHVSPEELQRFAGKYGEEAASQAFVSLEQWCSTEHARRAVWHAGQVFRWAAIMPPAELRDFYAIAVYFASLALWAFGHLSNSRDTSRGTRTRNKHASLEADRNSNSTCLVINTEVVTGASSFIAGRQIFPVLVAAPSKMGIKDPGSQDTLVRLDDPNAVLKMARVLYRNNFPIEGEPLPPLVDNMGNLMRDLSIQPESLFSRCASPMAQNGNADAKPMTSAANSGNGSTDVPPLGQLF